MRRKNSWCSGIILGLFFLYFFSCIGFVSALSISEIELNPTGEDRGNEWVEIYSSTSVSLEGFKIENVKGKIFALNGSCQDYCVFYTSYNFLTNDKQKLKLIDNQGTIVDESPEISDSKNDDKTWQLCAGWEFIQETKGKENSCGEEKNKQEEKEKEEAEVNEADKDEEIVVKREETIQQEKQVNIEAKNEIIKLGNKKIYESESEKIKRFALLAFPTFVLLIIVLFLISKRKGEFKKSFFLLC